MNKLVTILNVAVKDDFAVRGSLEPVAQAFQFISQLTKVVYLAIADKPQTVIAA
jgi:hypothetical protein